MHAISAALMVQSLSGKVLLGTVSSGSGEPLAVRCPTLGAEPLGARLVLPLGFSSVPPPAKGTTVLLCIPSDAPDVLLIIGTVEEQPRAETNSVELRCGQSRMELRGDGRVLLRGTDVTVRSVGQARLKGSSVRIN